MTRISSPLGSIQEHYDVIVIGSGYGGGIAASRLSRAGLRVCLLERGREIQPGEYPNTLVSAIEELQIHDSEGHVGSRTALFDLHVNPEQNVVVGCGLGGTSLINANVALEPDASVFDDPRWPAAIREHRDTLLREGYERARDMLKPTPYPEDSPTLPKLEAHRTSAASLGAAARFYKPPINVTFEALPNNRNHVGVEQHPCILCGDCVSGCNHRAKNTTLMNYLPDARNHGAQIFCETEVRYLERDGDAWVVHYQPLGTGREAFGAPTLFVKGDRVVLSAGTLGSTEILLRSCGRGLPLSDRLGQNMSGNGDILGFGYNDEEPINGIGFGTHSPQEIAPVGPCITSIIDMRDEARRSARMVIEEGSIPGALGRSMVAPMAEFAALIGVPSRTGWADRLHYKEREAASYVRGPYHGAMHNMQTYLVMSHDDGQGRMRLDGKDQLRIDWPGVGLQDNVKIGNERLQQATNALGGVWVINPIWTRLLKHGVVSVHPLGGCGMGEDASQGVVNHQGQVFSAAAGTDVHPGLYVADGSIIPTSLAVNPLLTISALCERNMSLLIASLPERYAARPPLAPPDAAPEPTLGVRFTETMKGWLSDASAAAPEGALDPYRAAAERGQAQDSPIGFTLTITADDVDRLISDPAHPATLLGTVQARALSPDALVASHGVFNLFALYREEVAVRHMTYDMRLTAVDGRVFFLSGFKTVPEDNGFLNLWRDTSTLYVTLYRGPDKTGDVIGLGVMHIAPADFARQMTTLKALNGTGAKQSLGALARFGKFFAGTLWESYGGIFTRNTYFNPDAAPRLMRPLDAPTPTVHFIRTADQVDLRLTRYRGGDKGPVMLVHGLGVGSTIFSTDAIQTNLLEYLCKHGYDVWLLDYRVSILLPASEQEWDGDQVARYDYVAAIAEIRVQTGADDIQCVVHCYGATTFFMSLLGGLQHVRSVVCSQIATDVVLGPVMRLKAKARLPGLLDDLGFHHLTAHAETGESWLSKRFDGALNIYARAQAQGYCTSAVCHRITFLYSSLYRHDNLNEGLHETLHELFGDGNIETFEHLALICRLGQVVDAHGRDVYMPHLDRLKLPICFISGAENRCYLPESTQRTFDRLSALHGPELYSRHVIPQYGHIDCVFGKDAVVDVYPLILDHLDRTA